MNIIVKCPDCGKGILAHAGQGYSSEIITTEKKQCNGCNSTIEIKIKIVASIVKPEKAEKKEA